MPPTSVETALAGFEPIDGGAECVVNLESHTGEEFPIKFQDQADDRAGAFLLDLQLSRERHRGEEEVLGVVAVVAVADSRSLGASKDHAKRLDCGTEAQNVARLAINGVELDVCAMQ
jgi:hypothetical protein